MDEPDVQDDDRQPDPDGREQPESTQDGGAEARRRPARPGGDDLDPSVPERRGTADATDDPDAPGMGVLDPESGWPEPNEPA